MKTLYESIIGSNNASIFLEFIHFIHNGRQNGSDVKELQKIWDDLKLSVNGCRWSIGVNNRDRTCREYVYNNRLLLTDVDDPRWDVEITDPDFFKYIIPDEKAAKATTELIKKIQNKGIPMIRMSGDKGFRDYKASFIQKHK